MNEARFSLAELIGSRICHDLISPVGAISNGLELLELSGQPRSPEIDLIADSVRNAGARIRFFRIAYGAAGNESLSSGEVRDILASATAGTRFTVHYAPEQPQPRALLRLAFLAMQCCETAMPRGGELTIGAAGDSWQVTGTGPRIEPDAALWAMLGRGTDPAAGDPGRAITPAQVQFALLPALAGAAGLALVPRISDQTVSLRF